MHEGAAMNARSTIDFRSPAAGFDQPLALWHACHERVARMTNLLERLVEHLKTHPVDEAAGVTASTVRRYFDEAAPRHHEDEEADLFPRLLARLERAPHRPDAQRIAAQVRRLLHDHAEMDSLWASLRAQLACVEAGTAPQFDDTQVALFINGYRAHIEIEENELAPLLHATLDGADLAAIGRAMAARRGVDWDEIAASGLQR
jgi:pyridoxamine 5'-phosphate oxidase